jgi:hypothetical protein
MDMALKARFIELWSEHVPSADLPLVFFYADAPAGATAVKAAQHQECFLGQLRRVRGGESLAFAADAIGCPGGQRYLGFSQALMPSFEYFLSCGIPGVMEGERYKKSPELVREFVASSFTFEASAPYIVFRRWDRLEASDEPLAVLFLAPPDVLSCLFTLAGFDESDPHAVIAPFAAGCGSIVAYAVRESEAERPRAVLGLFDVSARPFVPAGVLSFTVPWAKFVRMVGNMPESFLTTPSWTRVKRRLGE